MSFSNLSISTAEEDKNVYIITLNRPPQNRLDSLTCQELIAAYRSIVQCHPRKKEEDCANDLFRKSK